MFIYVIFYLRKIIKNIEMYNYIFMICVILYLGYDLYCLYKEYIFLFF